MAYVPGFKHDVFISYAHVVQSNWVKAFFGKLQEHLDRELHQTGASSIYWDRKDLDGHSPLSADIAQSISNTATLIIVLSNAYLDRPWCRKERETFFAHVGVGSRRAFLVHLEDVPLEKRPSDMQALDNSGYQFWEQHPDSEQVIHPLPVGDTGKFDARIRELAIALRRRLNELKENPPLPHSATVGANRPRLVGTKVFLADGIEGPRVKDLEVARSLLRSWLAEQQVVVLPEHPGTLYEQFIDPPQRELCASRVESRMQEATICVQLLGVSGDEDGYESWLCDRAKAAGKIPGKDLLLWRPKSLKEADIKSESHRALVFSAELQVIACDLTQFQNDVATHIEDIEREREAQSRVNAGGTGEFPAGAVGLRQSVLIDSAPEDRHLIEKLRQELTAVGIEYEPAQDAYDFEEMARSGAFDGVTFTFGNCTEDWVNQRLKATRPFRLAARSRQRPRVGVYREQSQRELTGTKGIDIIVDGNRESLSHFVAKLIEVAQ